MIINSIMNTVYHRLLLINRSLRRLKTGGDDAALPDNGFVNYLLPDFAA